MTVRSGSVVLTDDEVVALATDRTSYWPSGLPTVNTSDATDMASASFRGHRSLLARALLGDDGTIDDPHVKMLTESLPGRTDGVFVYLGDEQFRPCNWAIGSSHFADGDQWILESISDLGLHQLSHQPVADHRAYLEALLLGARDAGPVSTSEGADPATPVWLCVLGLSPGSTKLVRARRGEIRQSDMEIIDGVLTEQANSEIVDAHDAVDDLLSV